MLEKIKKADPRFIKSGVTVVGALLVGVAVFFIQNQLGDDYFISPVDLDEVVDVPEPPPFDD